MSPLFLKQSTVSLTVWSNGMKPTPKSINFLEGYFVLINQPCLSSLILKWKYWWICWKTRCAQLLTSGSPVDWEFRVHIGKFAGEIDQAFHGRQAQVASPCRRVLIQHNRRLRHISDIDPPRVDGVQLELLAWLSLRLCTIRDLSLYQLQSFNSSSDEPFRSCSRILRLVLTDGVKNGPNVVPGFSTTNCKPSFSANSHAAFSASVFETLYQSCTSKKMDQQRQRSFGCSGLTHGTDSLREGGWVDLIVSLNQSWRVSFRRSKHGNWFRNR